MEYFYYKSPKGNFGDDLNPWLWNKIWGNVDDKLENTYFLGIGSILFNKNSKLPLIQDQRKIVFGTGIRPELDHSKFKIDDSWKIYFLRGPLSARSLNNKYPFITDSAYAIRQTDTFKNLLNGGRKKYKVSLMPYFRSVDFVDWEKICLDLGINYISPYSENGVEETLMEIASSELLITEAMHGAILADALRVPWHRFVLTTPFTEGYLVSEFKWRDWMLSLDLEDLPISYFTFYSKGTINKWSKTLSRNFISIATLNKGRVMRDIKEVFTRYESLSYNLSNDSEVEQVDLKLECAIEKFQSELQLSNY